MTFGYFAAILIAIVFMLYMDGDIGVMMLAFLLLMPVLSIVTTLYVRKKLHVRMELHPDTVGKTQKTAVKLVLEKDTVLPLPFLRMELHADAHFIPLNPEVDPLPARPVDDGSARARREYKQWRKNRKSRLRPDTLPLCLSMGMARKAQYEIQLHPRYCGAGTVTLKAMRLSDYLAMLSVSVKQTCEASLLITPEIPELKANNSLFRAVATAVAAADEETEAMPNFSASSMPGYEHRDYIPGDSLKRINWKLSSKRHHLMVRQDEPIALARLSVVLDFRRKTEETVSDSLYGDDTEPLRTEMLEEEETLIETALGFLMLCAKYGYPCTLNYADVNGAWSSLSVDSAEQLAVEAVTLLRGGFRDAAKLSTLPLFPPQLMQESSNLLLYFTASCDPATAAGLETYPNTMYLMVPEQAAGRTAVPKNGSLWFVTPERQIVQGGGENA